MLELLRAIPGVETAASDCSADVYASSWSLLGHEAALFPSWA